MAEIYPFQGVHYNKSMIDDWTAVICDPYDIINQQQQQELYRKSEYNFVRLEFGRELPQDTVNDNKYTRGASTLEQWLAQGVLEVDRVPAVYLHDQYFIYGGKEFRRRGITARVRMEEWDRMVIRPHEGTTGEPKGDRLSLLWALKVNTSPILAMYQDSEKQISSVLAEQEKKQPLMDLKKTDGEGHTVWAISDPGAISQISSCLVGQPLYIADGHHRYESAMAYQQERLAYSRSTSGDEPFNFVMMTMVDFADPGLVILPPHRLVRGIPRAVLNELTDKLKVFFEIEGLPLSTHNAWQHVDRQLLARDDVRLVLFGLDRDNLYLLRLRDNNMAGQMMPHFHSDLYKNLDVSIVDHIVLEKLLPISGDDEKASLDYSYDRLDAVNKVLNQEYQLAFLLRPVRAETIKGIADAADRMPRKSTYFYPKLPAGLLINR
ncbi:MAG: DUF1015 domain-containing protein, partial [Dehalococcoidales bacterium]